MKWFFDQCFYRPGHPVFAVRSAWNESTGILELTVTQVQDTTTGVPVYKLPVAIGIIKADGQKVGEKVWLEDREETFQWQLDRKPKLIRFDEDNILLKEWTYKKEPEELLYQLRHDDVIGRMWAAGELGAHLGSPGVETAMIRSAQDDPFWSVRKAVLESMFNAGIKVPGDLLKTLGKDPHYQVRNLAITIYKSQIYNNQ